MSQRQKLSEWVMQPGTGKAVELRQGQILRIEQVEGGLGLVRPTPPAQRQA